MKHLRIHGPIKQRPKFDAGGLLVKDRSFAGADYVEKLAKKRVSDYKWTKKNQQAGLCGGSYYKREAILDALSDERVSQLDWNFLGERFTKEIYSSDFALQYALAARGWIIMPWEEAAQMHDNKDIPIAGPKDAAFRHYSGPVGKPTYEMKLRKEDARLVKDQPAKFRGKDSNCQLCYNLTRYRAIYGSADCTNELPFTYSNLLLQRYHPELKSRKCDLPWLCEPGSMLSIGQPSRGAINIVEGLLQEGQLRGSDNGEHGSEDEEEARADLARYGKNWQKVRRAVEAGVALNHLLQDVRESQANSLYERDWNRPGFGGSIKLMGPRMPTQFLGSPLLGSQRLASLAQTSSDSPLRGAAKSQKLRVQSKSQKDDDDCPSGGQRAQGGNGGKGPAPNANVTTFTMDDDDCPSGSQGGGGIGGKGPAKDDYPSGGQRGNGGKGPAKDDCPSGGQRAEGGNGGKGPVPNANVTTFTMDDDDDAMLEPCDVSRVTSVVQPSEGIQ
eukprot:symbB.v1.2.018939.t1/scaffold1487.1/size223630/9